MDNQNKLVGVRLGSMYNAIHDVYTEAVLYYADGSTEQTGLRRREAQQLARQGIPVEP
jgi:hypothetical protein